MALDAETIPFAQELGIHIVHYGDGRSELHYAPRAAHGNSLGAVHGGAIMTLLDITMAAAAMSAEDPDQGAVTIEMKTSFMRAVRLASSQALVGRGKLLRRTRKMAFVEARIFDAGGEFSAHATGTFKLVRRSSSQQHPAVGG